MIQVLGLEKGEWDLFIGPFDYNQWPSSQSIYIFY